MLKIKVNDRNTKDKLYEKIGKILAEDIQKDVGNNQCRNMKHLSPDTYGKRAKRLHK
jgi:hypothetical protein